MRVEILFADAYSGGMTRAYALAQVVARLGHEVEISGPVIRGRTLYPEPPPGVPVRVFHGLVSHGLWPSRRAANGSPDVLIARKPWLGSFGVALRRRSATGTPVILDCDDWEPPGMGVSGRRAPSLGDRARGLLRSARRLHDPSHPLYSRTLQRLVPRADAVTAATHLLADKFGGTLVPHGRDTDVFDPSRYDADACRQALGLEDKTVLLFPGTPRPHKGLEDVLQALDRLGRPELRLVVAGGRRTDFARELSERGSRWLVELPQRAADQMPAVVAAAHAVVVPQRDVAAARAQFPIKLTDAMAMAKPILTTRVGDIPEIVGDSAYLLEPSSPEALAVSIEKVLADPAEAGARGARARERCIERFSLEAVGRILGPLIEGVVERATRPGARATGLTPAPR